MADFLAVDQFDIQTLNLNWYEKYYYDSDVVKSANVPIDDIVYPDWVWIAGFDGTSDLELDFFGRNITYNSSGDITGGTVNFIDEYDFVGESLLWFIEGVSISAKSIYDTLFTVSNADEVAIIQSALAGDDLIILSPFDDRMNGYDGDDIMSGGLGSDTLDGRAGTDTAVFADHIENYTVSFQGDTILVASPTEGTDQLTGFEFVSFAGVLRSAASLADTVRPDIVGFSPADGVADAATGANIVLTFSEAIQRGTGTLTLRTGSAGGTIVEQYDAATSDRLTISGSTLTIDPANVLVGGTHYFVIIDPGALTDLAGNTFTGTTAYDFTTVMPGFVLLAPTGFAGEIGGSGKVAGSNSIQDISVLSGSGQVNFDGSFNRGDDIIRLPGNAGSYSIMRLGSSTAVLSDTVSTITIPVGTVGQKLVFDDGVRTLVFDSASASMKIGGQAFSTTAIPIAAPAEQGALPTGIDPTAQATVILLETAHVTLGGDYRVLGTNSIEQVDWRSGDLMLDASFNRGGDLLVIDQDAPAFTATRVGSSSVLLHSATGDITIPLGTSGMTLQFADATRIVRFDIASNSVLIGEQVIPSGTPVTLTQGTTSLDQGSALSPATIALHAGPHILTDDATKAGNVRISNFTSDDVIQVTGASAAAYSFAKGDADNDGGTDDLIIHFATNDIAILNAVAPGAAISDLASAQAALGWSFISFG